MVRTAQTTTLIVTKPIDYNRLEKEYKLIRYVLPSSFRPRVSKNKNLYGQMHNALRDQLDCPYKTFKYDKLESDIPRWVVYALYPRDAEPQTVTIPFLSDKPLDQKPISFASLELHLLLKLLHIAYFRGTDNEVAERFIGQDRCYVYARYDKNKGAHVCLEVEIKGDIRNQADQLTEEFKIVGHAHPFRRVDSIGTSYAYFGSRAKGKRRYFIHLKRSEILKAVHAQEPIYTIRPQEKQRTTLAFHDQHHIEACVGKILYDFIRDFQAYLARYGISCTSKERAFNEFVPPKKQGHLSLTQLHSVFVYDNRLEQEKCSFQQCLKLFSSLVPEVNFIPVTDLVNVQDKGVLIVQDHNKEDFEEGGILQDREDPYDILYQKFTHLPKQSISVNTNAQKEVTVEEYLDYTLPKTDDKASKQFKQRLEVALFQLYLKEVILYGKSVTKYLPFAPTRYMFIRKDRYYSNPYETLLYFDNDRLHFLDLRDPDAIRKRDELFSKLGVSWAEMYNRMRIKYRKNQDDDEEKEVFSYDIIVGPGLFVELEDLNERILYNYDEILARQNAVDTDIPINDLKLSQHYDLIRGANDLTYGELYRRGLLNGQAQPKNDSEEDSLVLYRRLEKYDDFLDEVARTHMVISFNNLTQGELWERIIAIFGYKPDKNGRLTRAPFKAMYQKRGWFFSDKSRDLHLYEGIWYDENNCYMIGSAQSLNVKQPRAHLLRRFDVYTETEQFDMHPLLLAMSVQFVRHKQYTVYPYPFHLIDLYVENVLRFH